MYLYKYWYVFLQLNVPNFRTCQTTLVAHGPEWDFRTLLGLWFYKSNLGVCRSMLQCILIPTVRVEPQACRTTVRVPIIIA